MTGEAKGAAAVTENQVLDALKGVTDPESGEDVVSLNMVSGIIIKDGNVTYLGVVGSGEFGKSKAETILEELKK